MKRIKYWYKLKHIPRLSPILRYKLIEELGEPENFIGKGLKPLSSIEFLNNPQKQYLACDSFDETAEKLYDEATKHGLNVVYITDNDYPERLKEIDVPPLYLYYKGNYDKNIFKRCIGFVGTRKPSNYGQICARKLARDTAKNGFTIVSGLAYGIDSISHKATLDAGGTTVAILGTGLDNIYPVSHQGLAKDICKKGCILSEYDPLSVYNKGNFPTRNRIISGLSLGVVIVEGALKSGSLITAKFALEQNRDVFALPGDIDRTVSKGPNMLIKKGAIPITSYKDITQQYELAFTDEQLNIFPKLEDDEENIYKCVQKYKDGIMFDDLSIKTGLDLSTISLLLLQLEIKGVVKKTTGGKIVALY